MKALAIFMLATAAIGAVIAVAFLLLIGVAVAGSLVIAIKVTDYMLETKRLVRDRQLALYDEVAPSSPPFLH